MAVGSPRAETVRDGRRGVRTGLLAVVGLVVLIAFGVTLYGGYGPADWTWTGYEKAQLWDWLHVLLLPRGKAHHLLFITVFVAAIAVLAVGGYTQGLDWTGFEGNTLFDWLKLIFLPVVIPLVVIPLALGLRQSRSSG